MRNKLSFADLCGQLPPEGIASVMKKKTIRFLWTSLICLTALCIAVFTYITRIMIARSDQTLTQVANLYMEEINIQLQRHFNSLVEMKLEQAAGITVAIPPSSVPQLDERAVSLLTTAGQSRNFSYMALYSTQGSVDVLYGEDVTLYNADVFLDALNQANPMVTMGQSPDGETLLVFGTSVGYPHGEGYPIRDGGECTALLVGIPISYINTAMSLNIDNTLVFSHIIQTDGEFVLRNSNNAVDNYYDWLLESCEFEDQTAQQAVEGMQQAVAQGETFSMVILVDGQLRHVFCSPLSHSQWYLVTVMPHGPLDEAVSSLGLQRVMVTLAGCGILLVATLVIFVLYLRMSRRQLAAVEKAQREAERASRAKSEFLSNMSHDIRTPMNAIVGMTAIASANLDNPAQVRDCLRKITLSSKHLLGLINDVLDMSKIESGKLTLNIDVMSLQETAENIVNIIQPQIKAKKQQFDIIIRDICQEMVYCDNVRLNQVLLNLLSNALKFTPEGGRIAMTISQQPSEQGENFVRTVFVVEDTGIGMSEEFQEKVFDSFAREDNARVQRTEGTGLGMAITKYIVDEMQGSITVSSQPGKGSRFEVALDLEIAPDSGEEMILPSWEMLVVDDDEPLCRSAAACLQQIGVQAEWTTSGRRAIEMACDRHSQHRDYHIILLDWKMPDMDGIETARRLRAAVGEAVPILLISAYDWSDIEAEAKEAGISGFLPKPLFKSTLYRGLSRFAGSAPAGEAEPAPEQADFSGVRLLLAEDNELNWEIASELLRAQGFTVDWAENGQKCLEMFQASQPGDYRLILMDLRMPVMNGYEATQAIRALDRPDAASIPIIAMTADAFSEDVHKCLACGMNAHMAKPLDMRELLRLIQKFLG